MTAAVESLPVFVNRPYPVRKSSLLTTVMPILEPPIDYIADDTHDSLAASSPTRPAFPARKSSLDPVNPSPHSSSEPSAEQAVASTANKSDTTPKLDEEVNSGSQPANGEDLDLVSSSLTNFAIKITDENAKPLLSTEAGKDTNGSEEHMDHLNSTTESSSQESSGLLVEEEPVQATPTIESLPSESPRRPSLRISRTEETLLDPIVSKKTRPGFSSKLRRRSWLPGSRSPSPHKSSASSSLDERKDPDANPRSLSAGRREITSTVISSSAKQTPRQTSFSRQLAQRLRKRSSNVIPVDEVIVESPTKAADLNSAQLQKSASEDKISLPSLVPSTRSSDRLSSYVPSDYLTFALSTKTRQARKRDDLWAAFRDLETACPRFQTKHIEQKGSVLRTTLLPFLQEYESHPSNLKLHPEDLERRAMILHKWWTTLLEFVKSRTYPMASNGTRTMVLDAIIGIMERPEWRHAPSPFCPVLSKRNSDAVSESCSSNSDSEFFIESVQHNVRNYFSQCLLSQMAFAIEKMTARAVPSLVTFCGKTCAYAFFFCTGVAALLVQLWRPSMDTMKRVLEESGLSASSNLSDTVEKISSFLPPTLKEVQVSSLAEAFRSLRVSAPIPVGTENIAWKGAWLDRWTGQDSDLFFAFVRQYYVILFDYLPEASKVEKLVAAGGLYVQAQIIVNMDATIQRHLPKPDPSQLQGPGPRRLPGYIPKEPLRPQEERKQTTITFDDVLSADPDSSASPIPLGPTNADRIMAENRLIMLLRDVLISYASQTPKMVRDSFAQMFSDLMRAMAKATPQFNRFASDALCDFMEEAVVILVRYEQTNGIETPFLDWPFWFGVWKLMAKSNNYFTEMKVYSIIYTLWPAISVHPERKADLCFNFLLEKDHFESRFSHWSPMVRAYYMRLLAWRVARVNEDATEDDLNILECLADRLTSVYGTFLYLRDQGTAQNTSPSNPAPNRRFIIVRADSTQSTRSGAVITFDAPSTPHNAAYKRSIMLEQLCSPDIPVEDRPQTAISFASSTASDSDRDIDDSPKRWTGGLLRTIIGSSKNARSQSQSPSRSKTEQSSRSSSPKPTPAQQITSSPSDRNLDSLTKSLARTFPSFRTYCFRFSLELIDRRMGSPAPVQLQAPRLPQPGQTLLTRHQRGLTLQDSSTARRSPTPSSPSTATFATAPSSTSEAGEGESEAAGDSPESAARASEVEEVVVVEAPVGTAKRVAAYAGRALAEWSVLVSECHMFFERRKAEGVPGNRWVETPLLGTEILRRPF